MPNAYATIETIMLSAILVSAISLLLRLRRAQGVERQQIKWYAYAVTVTITGAIVTYAIARPMGVEWLRWVGYPLLVLGVLAIPVAMGVAILRYRLYDIDIIIRRTLVYGVLTATLAALYFSSVALLQFVSRALTDEGRQQPQWAIVISTLVIAALFQPIRHRIQRFIDRRFYRRKYDATRTLAEFGTRLRQEVDLDTVSDDLISVVYETVQPEQASLWLREPSP